MTTEKLKHLNHLQEQISFAELDLQSIANRKEKKDADYEEVERKLKMALRSLLSYMKEEFKHL